MGCGTAFPATEVNDDAGLDASDRRVDLLLVPATLELDVTEAPPGRGVYGPHRDVRYIPFDELGPLLVVTDEQGMALAGAKVELELESGEIVEKTTDGRGVAEVKDVSGSFTVRKIVTDGKDRHPNHVGPTVPA